MFKSFINSYEIVKLSQKMYNLTIFNIKFNKIVSVPKRHMDRV